MGQMIDEEDCEVCIPFDQEWIYLRWSGHPAFASSCFCFPCAFMTEKFKSVASALNLFCGNPFISEADSVVEDISKKVEESELGDDADVNVEDKEQVSSRPAPSLRKNQPTWMQGGWELTRFQNRYSCFPTESRSRVIQTIRNQRTGPPINIGSSCRKSSQVLWTTEWIPPKSLPRVWLNRQSSVMIH